MGDNAILIAGPTASGKSSLALALAEALDGVIINTDSMQVYQDLHVLTARPDKMDHQRVPHKLYGYLDGGEVCSAARWAGDAEVAIRAALASDKIPVLVGGTGLYFRAVLHGLSDMPIIPDQVRTKVRQDLAQLGSNEMHQCLQAVDPRTADRLDPGDQQRIARALEVFYASGKPISWFQSQVKPGCLANAYKKGSVHTFVIDWPREALYARCNSRFETMLTLGAVEEVQSLLTRGLSEDRPVMKALGVPELAAYLKGTLTLDQARERAMMMTRRFAKRQMTWFRNQTREWTRIDGQEINRKKDEIIQNWN